MNLVLRFDDHNLSQFVVMVPHIIQLPRLQSRLVSELLSAKSHSCSYDYLMENIWQPDNHLANRHALLRLKDAINKRFRKFSPDLLHYKLIGCSPGSGFFLNSIS